MSEISDQLITALYRQDYTLVTSLVTEANVNSIDQDGRTLLMLSILENAGPTLVKYLLDHGADANRVDEGRQWTALHFAARDQHFEIVKLLLEAGVEVDPVDTLGNTPLMEAVKIRNYDPDVVRLLLSHGADPDRANIAGSSPKVIAQLTGNTELLNLLDQR